jgi:hypothetical protein
MNNRLGCATCILLAAFLTPAAQHAVAAAAQHPGFPLGVYWAGENTFIGDPAMLRWRRIDRVLDSLLLEHVNAIWLTHLSAADTAELTRRAATRGIGVVASIAQLAGEEVNVRHGARRQLISRALADWGDAPAPLAWGIADEPRAAWMNEIAAYVEDWRRLAPDHPLTTIVMPLDVDSASSIGFEYLAMDSYPFFGRGDPNGLGTDPIPPSLARVDHLVAKAHVPWIVVQAFQEPWGPFRVNGKGNITYLAGGAPHWVMPTPAQVRWQANASVARGARGIFFFHLLASASSQPLAAPCQLPDASGGVRDSNSPLAMLYPDGRATPQYRAMGAAYRWLDGYRTIFSSASLASEIRASIEAPTGGDLIGMFKDRATRSTYLMVVGSYLRPRPARLSIRIDPGIKDVVGLTNRQRIRIRRPSSRTASGIIEITVAPGGAELLQVSDGT